MQINIPYSGERIGLEVDDEQVNTVLYPHEVEKRDEEEVILRALKDPVDRPSFSEFIEDGTVFIVNDATRPTPTARVLDLVKEKIDEHDVKFIVATGSHREPTEEEYGRIFGDLYDIEKECIFHHDSKNDEMIDHGETERGTPVKFNREVSEAEKVIAINTVEPHYFAGFTGGRKSLLPGIAGYETITANHEYALKEKAKTLNLEDNPVHLDMMDAVGKFEGEVFALNMTLDKDGDVYSASAGSLKESFLSETDTARDLYGVELDEKSEVVVTAAHPIDVDLYQSHKALENGKLALKDGGIIILVSECPEGIGPRNFYDLMSSLDDPEDVLDKIQDEYKLGYHKAAKLVQLCKDSSVWCVSGLEDDVVKKAFIRSKDDLQDAVDEALSITEGKVTFLVEGGMVVPMTVDGKE